MSLASKRSWPLLLAVVQFAAACTYFEVRSKAGAPMVLANTLEWFSQDGIIPDSKLWKAIVTPRGKDYKPSCKGGSGWKGKFGFLAMGVKENFITTDALNEAGLSVSQHAIRGIASYLPPNATSSYCSFDVATWVASSFSSVAELSKTLPSVGLLFSGSGTTSMPGMQFAVTDASGDSIVIDTTDGGLHIHNNTGVGILTNDPEYSWQLKNLNNYVGLSGGWPSDNKQIEVASDIGQVPSVVGHGQNLLGLPGDVSPPSRFVRTFFIRQYALQGAPPKTMDEALVLADGVLNTQFIVKGMNAKTLTEPSYDHVIFSTMKVPEKKLFFYRTYEDNRWRKVDLNAVDFSEESATLPSFSSFGAVDVTRELKQVMV